MRRVLTVSACILTSAPLQAQEASEDGLRQQTSVFVDFGAQHSPQDALNRELTRGGLSSIGTMYSSIGLGLVSDAGSFGAYAGLQGLTQRSSARPGGSAKIGQGGLVVGGHWIPLRYRVLTVASALGMYVGEVRLEDCKGDVSACPARSGVAALDGALHLRLRLGSEGGFTLGTAVGYRQQFLRTDWSGSGVLRSSNPHVDVSGAFVRLSAGYWFWGPNI